MVSQALAISLAAGVAVMGVIEAFGTQLLRRTIGADGPLLVPVALKVSKKEETVVWRGKRQEASKTFRADDLIQH